MARMVSRSRPTGGKGIGERISELAVYVVIVAAVVFAARWYFVVYKNSPTYALLGYLGASKGGDVSVAYNLLTTETREMFGSHNNYDEKFPLARGYTGSLVDYKIDKITEAGNKAEADVTMTVRQSKQEIYQAGTDNYKDHFVLKKESGSWRIALTDPKTDIKSQVAGGR